MFFCKRRAPSHENLIFVRDMIVDMYIGAYDDERGKLQKVRINITVEPSIWPNKLHDNLGETLSYDALVNHVLRIAKTKEHTHLVETVAERIADACLGEMGVQKVIVRVEKLKIYDFAVPGVEITRSKR